MENLNSYKIAQLRFDQAAEKLQLEDWLVQMLNVPNRNISVEFPVKMDDGSIKMFSGFRVQHNNIRGPYKGGLRFSPHINLDETRALAACMTWKTSLLNIPFGGAKGGVVCNPKELSMSELERMTKRFTVEMMDVFGPEIDIPAPDMNTNEQIMSWIFDAFSMLHHKDVSGVVTGKPVHLGGTEGRREATGQGVSIVALEAVKDMGLDPKNLTAIIQGYGNVGSYVAQFLTQAGVKIIGISDVSTAIYSKYGLDIDSVNKHLEENDYLENYNNNVKHMDPKEGILERTTDLLIPAALENQITGENADRIKAKIIVEGANGPTTPLADEILNKKNIIDIPDILANAGGAIVSYFEWVQNIQKKQWKPAYIISELQDKLVTTYKEVRDLALSEKTDMRTAAHMKAIDRVAQASKSRGIFP